MIYHDTSKYSILLSLLDDSDFQPEDDHNHDQYCSTCIDLLLVLNEVKELTDTMPNANENKEENVNDVAQTASEVFNWKKHILQGVKQNQAKQYAMTQISSTCGFWISDLAQKVIPSKFREGQHNYHAKKEMSLHVDVLILKTDNDEIRKCTYFTALGNYDQDLDTFCITDHVLCETKKDSPDLQTLNRKSDNAGCYAGNSVAGIEYSLCKKNEKNLLRHDYNEPQCGKYKADRDTAVAKKFLNAYIHSGNDCSSVYDIQKGILHNGGANNVKVSVAETDKSASQMSESKIRNIHSYHFI